MGILPQWSKNGYLFMVEEVKWHSSPCLSIDLLGCWSFYELCQYFYPNKENTLSYYQAISLCVKSILSHNYLFCSSFFVSIYTFFFNFNVKRSCLNFSNNDQFHHFHYYFSFKPSSFNTIVWEQELVLLFWFEFRAKIGEISD